SGNRLAVESGVDLPFVAYRDALGLSPEPLPDARVGVKYIHLGWDWRAFRASRRAGGLGWAEWLRSLRGVRCDAIFDRRDLRPFLRYVAEAVRPAGAPAANAETP